MKPPSNHPEYHSTLSPLQKLLSKIYLQSILSILKLYDQTLKRCHTYIEIKSLGSLFPEAHSGSLYPLRIAAHYSFMHVIDCQSITCDLYETPNTVLPELDMGDDIFWLWFGVISYFAVCALDSEESLSGICQSFSRNIREEQEKSCAAFSRTLFLCVFVIIWWLPFCRGLTDPFQGKNDEYEMKSLFCKSCRLSLRAAQTHRNVSLMSFCESDSAESLEKPTSPRDLQHSR